MAAVRLEALTKRYGEDVAAVRDLTLEIRHGELLSLLGPSGCGKTTTLRLIAGFLTPDAGEIWLGDRRLSSPGEAVAVSIRPHAVALAPVAGVGAPAADGARLNVFTGTVTRASYFGDAMDYQVAIAGADCTLRAAGAPESRLTVGQAVVVRIAADRCILVR